MKTLVTAAALSVMVAAPAAATPFFQEFGPLPEATFGGSGIPNDPVAIATILNGVDLTIGLSATQRFAADPVTNDGAGTYFADPGTALSPTNTNGSLWNFNFFVDVGNENFTDYRAVLYYEFDGGLDTIPLGTIELDLGLDLDPTSGGQAGNSRIEGSQNLLFQFLEDGLPGVVFPPAGSFDPNAFGEYTFELRLFEETGAAPATTPLLQVAIDVVVGDPTAVNEPAGLGLLFGTALAGLGLARRRRR